MPAGDLMHAVYAASFAPAAGAHSGTYFPLAWNENYTQVRALDVTAAYLATEPLSTAAGAAAAGGNKRSNNKGGGLPLLPVGRSSGGDSQQRDMKERSAAS